MKNYKQKQTKLSCTIAALLLTGLVATTVQAGKITSVPSAAEAPNAPEFVAEGFGGWNLGNVNVVVNGGGTFDPLTGFYIIGDGTYTGDVYDKLLTDDTRVLMGQVLAKDYPVGEPSGIKVINGDTGVKNGKPENCIMATSYLADHFLDSVDPWQVTCSSGFQTHKRYKLAMMPTAVDGLGSEGIDLVFNVEAEGDPISRDYQVFQKINNWTDSRLEGFTIQVGFGIGADFQSTSEEGVALINLHLTIPEDIWAPEQLAVFSEGLFGPWDEKTETIGFFDPTQRAGFSVVEKEYDDEPFTDTLLSNGTLGSDYARIPPVKGPDSQFGPWLPNSMLPQGIFFDDDGNPETDAELLAWYGANNKGALGWLSGSQGSEDNPSAFSTISPKTIQEMGENLSYTMGEIDDLVNVGLNYIVTVGDVSTFPGTTFTIRITPTKDTSGIGAPAYVGVTPDPLLLFTSSDADVLLEPKDMFVVGSLLTARVGDADLNVPVDGLEIINYTTVYISAVVPVGENPIDDYELTLVEQGENRGVFAATLPDDFSNVEPGTVVTMSYVDEDDGKGGADVIKTSSSTAIPEPGEILSDTTITDFTVPVSIFDGLSRKLRVSIVNDPKADGAATGHVAVVGKVSGEILFDDIPVAEFSGLMPGQKKNLSFNWTATRDDFDPDDTTVEWTAILYVEDEDGALQSVDSWDASTEVIAKPGKN